MYVCIYTHTHTKKKHKESHGQINFWEIIIPLFLGTVQQCSGSPIKLFAPTPLICPLHRLYQKSYVTILLGCCKGSSIRCQDF